MRWKVQFQSPTKPSSSSWGDSLNIKISLFLCLVVAPLLGGMDNLYGDIKEPSIYLGTRNTIELVDFIQESTHGGTCNNYTIRNSLHPSLFARVYIGTFKGLQWMIIMSFNEPKGKDWGVVIVLVVQLCFYQHEDCGLNGAMTIPNNNFIIGNRNGCNTTIDSGGANLPLIDSQPYFRIFSWVVNELREDINGTKHEFTYKHEINIGI